MMTINGVGTTIYGRANEQDLVGNARLEAEEVGYHPHSYQVVMWFVFLYMPVVPLGTYRVMEVRQNFWALDSRYAMVPVEWDWHQVATHYAAAFGSIIALIALVALVGVVGG